MNFGQHGKNSLRAIIWTYENFAQEFFTKHLQCVDMLFFLRVFIPQCQQLRYFCVSLHFVNQAIAKSSRFKSKTLSHLTDKFIYIIGQNASNVLVAIKISSISHFLCNHKVPNSWSLLFAVALHCSSTCIIQEKQAKLLNTAVN